MIENTIKWRKVGCDGRDNGNVKERAKICNKNIVEVVCNTHHCDQFCMRTCFIAVYDTPQKV